MLDFKEPIKIKDIPSGFYIMLGMMALAAAWAIQGISGCAAIEAQYRAERHKYYSESNKAFWDANRNK